MSVSAIAKAALQEKNTKAGVDIEDVFSSDPYYAQAGQYVQINHGLNINEHGGFHLVRPHHAGTSVGASIASPIFQNSKSGRLGDDTNYMSLTLKSALAPNSGQDAIFFGDGYTSYSTINSAFIDDQETFMNLSFRCAPRFMDMVTYTGNGQDHHRIKHNLGIRPGMIIVKQLRSATNASPSNDVYNTAVWHTGWSLLDMHGDTTIAPTRYGNPGTDGGMTSEYIDTYYIRRQGTNGQNANSMNTAGEEYVAIIFASDKEGPSGDYSDGLIECGEFFGSLSGQGATKVQLGWQPDLLMFRCFSETGTNGAEHHWHILDTQNNWYMDGGDTMYLSDTTDKYTNSSITQTLPRPVHDGFIIPHQGQNSLFTSGRTFKFLAIRGSRMKTPKSAREVFQIATKSQSTTSRPPVFHADWPVDWVITKENNATPSVPYVSHKNIHNSYLRPDSNYLNTVEDTGITTGYDSFAFNNGFSRNDVWAEDTISLMFRNAKDFCSTVFYDGGVASQQIKHHLGQRPQIVMIKSLQNSDWFVWTPHLSSDHRNKYLMANQSGNVQEDAAYIYGADETYITIGTSTSSAATNSPAGKHLAWCFGNVPGISKIGLYEGGGTTEGSGQTTVVTGFTPRFIMLKDTNSPSGAWKIFAAEGNLSGINQGTTDNYFYFNLAQDTADNTSADEIDPVVNGFRVDYESLGGLNAAGTRWLYWAIA